MENASHQKNPLKENKCLEVSVYLIFVQSDKIFDLERRTGFKKSVERARTMRSETTWERRLLKMFPTLWDKKGLSSMIGPE